jgi:GH24 family phage-related lysozyme (muramidase)
MDDFIAEQGISGSGSTKYADYTQGGLDSDSYREIPITTNPLGVEDYRGGHMDEDNTVAHLRLSDKVDEDGKRVLFIEELQSDWHQQGRKGGYSTKENNRKIMKLETEADRLKRDYESSMTYDEGEKIRNRLAEIEKEKVSLMGVVPDAPLKGSKWQQMGFKRAMQIASDEGYDRVAWTTSEQQLNLYNSKNSDGVRRLDSKGKVQYKELYENLYDKKLTSYSKKYASKNGSQTGKVEIDFNGTTEVNYIDVTPKLKAKLKEKGQSSYSVAPIAPIAGGGLLGTQEESQAEETKGGILNNVKSWKPNNNLVTFVKTMENDPLRVGNAKVKEYDDVGHKAKGYGTKSGLLAQDTEAEASKALNSQLVKANKAVDRLVKIDLNEDQRNALVSLVYNVGEGAFAKSNALKALNNGNIKTFLKEAFDPKIGFVKAGGKISNGLVRRRAREKSIFTKGNYGN